MQIKLGEIIGREVNTLTGIRLGHLANVELEASSGNLTTLLVDPRAEVSHMTVPLDQTGRLRLPFSSIRSVKDVIMVEYDIPSKENNNGI